MASGSVRRWPAVPRASRVGDWKAEPALSRIVRGHLLDRILPRKKRAGGVRRPLPRCVETISFRSAESGGS